MFFVLMAYFSVVCSPLFFKSPIPQGEPPAMTYRTMDLPGF